MEKFNERVIIVNDEADFIQNDDSEFSVNYIILCENSEDEPQIYKNSVCGLSIAEWVAMACENKPVFLNISQNENFLDLIRPYANEREYMVVLYANTPLITKTHLRDLIGYVKRKRFNACKLKKGYILRSEYVLDAEAIYSNFLYDLTTNDFFEVKTISDIETVRCSLESRMFTYHRKNGVLFDNQSNINISANVKIGEGTKICGGASVLKNSTIGNNSIIEPNVVIVNSKIGDTTIIKSGSIVENSIIKNNSEIASSSSIIHAVIGEETHIGISSKIIDSMVGNGAVIDNFVNLDNANILASSKIGKFSNVVGLGVTVVVEENAEIAPFSNLIQSEK